MGKEEALLDLNHSCYEMINHCETKINILTAIDVGIIAAIVGVYGSNNFYYEYRCTPVFIICTTYFSLIVIGAICSIVVCLIASISRFIKPSEEKLNPFFYYDIAEINVETYEELLKNDKKMTKDLMLENIAISKVLKKKYLRFNLALRFLLYPIMLLFLPLISYFIKKWWLKNKETKE